MRTVIVPAAARREPAGQRQAEGEHQQTERAEIAQGLWQQVQRDDTDHRRQGERTQRSERTPTGRGCQAQKEPEQHGDRGDDDGKQQGPAF